MVLDATFMGKQPEPKGLKPNLTINVHVISTPNRLILAYIAGIQDFNNNTSDLARSQDTLELEVII